jgi:hypothetical protein
MLLGWLLFALAPPLAIGGSDELPAQLLAASRAGHVGRLRALLDAGAPPGGARGGSTPLMGVIEGWGNSFSAHWPAPLPAGVNYSASLSLLLARGAPPAQDCPTLDAASFAFAGALGALFDAMNASEARACLTYVDATGGVLAHVLVLDGGIGMSAEVREGVACCLVCDQCW